MYTRNKYLEKIEPFIGKPVIKAVTGMRRVGKSCLLQLIMDELRSRSVSPDRIVYINKELLAFDFIRNHTDLHRYIHDRTASRDQPTYLFIDEIQEIENWERALADLLAQGGYDIFVSGSNARMLSSDIATLIAGRYVEIPVYSLSFPEYLYFRGASEDAITQEFQNYLWAGGLPGIHHFDFQQEIVYQYIASIYDTILLRDVIKRHAIRNVALLENITRYVFDNIGNIFSAKKIADHLKSQRLRIGVDTVQNYLAYLAATHAIHRVNRFDIRGRRLLEMHEKYYLNDVALRHALLGYRQQAISGILENLVYLELRRRGYRVSIGKIDTLEINFIAEKQDQKIYLQVAYLLSTPETVQREAAPLRRVKDNYPKYIVSTDTHFGSDLEGIRRVNIVDFLLDRQGR